MTERPKPTEVAAVKCEVCLTEIPRSEAHCAEAEDYVLYFCGLDCYREWAASGGKATAPIDPSRRG
ncbi:MAG: DUF3330 domain-containing protein [Bacteroidota bacterium]|jgi:hypothetical protein